MTTDRYARQLLLPEIGAEGQVKLRAARVLIVGVGGLGSPLSLYLAGAGIGTLGLVDDDVVSPSNLHRQILYTTPQTGLPKALEAAKRLTALNDDVSVVTHACRLTKENAEEIIAQYDLVVDGTDNFATRYVIDDACAALRKPYVYGAVCQFDAQAAVFHHGASPARYRTLFPDEAAMLAAPPPSKAIIGPTAGLCASVEAAQVVALICGYDVALSGRLWWINLKTMESGEMAL